MADKKKAPPPSSSAPEVRSSSLDVESLRQIVDILEASEVTRLVWRNGREKLFIRRGPATVTQVMQPMMAAAPAAVHVTAAAPAHEKPRPSAPLRPTAPAAAAAEPEKKGHLITSPFVGTFYRTPAPDQPPFVDVGSVVKKGQVLCIVEAMKLMNEIESEVAGKIVEILGQNAQPVEFGQPLCRIEPA